MYVVTHKNVLVVHRTKLRIHVGSKADIIQTVKQLSNLRLRCCGLVTPFLQHLT